MRKVVFLIVIICNGRSRTNDFDLSIHNIMLYTSITPFMLLLSGRGAVSGCGFLEEIEKGCLLVLRLHDGLCIVVLAEARRVWLFECLANSRNG